MQAQSFKPSEEMTFETVQADCQRLLKFCNENKELILHVDLSEVRHCDSAGLALLIEARRLSFAQKKDCKMIAVPKIIQSFAAFCGVDEILGLALDD